MLKIRLQRTGRRNQPSYRVVVSDSRKSPFSGRHTEVLGSFNPFTKEKKLKKERILYWIGVGAKPSPTVHNILVSGKIVQAPRIFKHKKGKEKKELLTASQ